MYLSANTNGLKFLSVRDAISTLYAMGITEIEITTDGGVHVYPVLSEAIETEDIRAIVAFVANTSALPGRVSALSGGWCDFYTNDTKFFLSQSILCELAVIGRLRMFLHNPHNTVALNTANVNTIISNIQETYVANGGVNPNIALCFETHGGISINAGAMTDIMESLTANEANVGITLDPANLLRFGVDPLKFLEKTRKWVRHVHVKDYSIRREEYCCPGKGDVDWKSIFLKLGTTCYKGALSVEYEGATFSAQPLTEYVIATEEILRGI